jgi:hypothetical protein
VRCPPEWDCGRVCIPEEAEAAKARAEIPDEVTTAPGWPLAEGRGFESRGQPSRPGERVTPSFTEAEWTEVLAAWLATKHTSMFGRARPTANAEDRAEAAAEIAAWLIAAAGEVLES